MVEQMVPDEFLPREKKRFSHSIHVLAQSVSALSSSKNVYHILRMVEQMMPDEIPPRELSFFTYTAISNSLCSCLVDHMMLVKFPSRHYTFLTFSTRRR